MDLSNKSTRKNEVSTQDFINKPPTFNVFLIRLLTVYTMITIYSPIISFNMPAYFGRTYFLLPIWIILIIFSNPKILFSRNLFIFYIFFIIYLIGSFIFWNELKGTRAFDLSVEWVFRELYGYYIAILIYSYFVAIEDFYGIAIVTLITLIFIISTCVTSVIAISTSPGLIRMIGKESLGIDNITLFKRGVAPYTFWGSLVCLFPAIIYTIKDKETNIILRIMFIAGGLFLVYSLFESQFSTAFFLSVIIAIYSFFSKTHKPKKIMIYLILMILIMFIFNIEISKLLLKLASMTDAIYVKDKLEDMSNVFKFRDFNPNSNVTYFSRVRLRLIFISLEKFLHNPIIGGGGAGGHSTWIDRLGMFGLFGFTPWIIIYNNQIKQNMHLFVDPIKPYYVLSISSCIFLGLLTTTANSYQSGAAIFYLVPGIFFLSSSKRMRGYTTFTSMK